jgi:hypothetical protein
MWRYRGRYGNRHPYGFYNRRGFGRGNPFMWLIPLLLLVLFGGFIFKFLFWIAPFLLIMWGVSKIMGWNHHHHSYSRLDRDFRGFGHHGSFDDSEKVKNDEYDDDKPKRQYIQTSDGQWVEIV